MNSDEKIQELEKKVEILEEWIRLVVLSHNGKFATPQEYKEHLLRCGYIDVQGLDEASKTF